MHLFVTFLGKTMTSLGKTDFSDLFWSFLGSFVEKPILFRKYTRLGGSQKKNIVVDYDDPQNVNAGQNWPK